MLCFDGTRDGDLYLQLASGRFLAGHGLAGVDPFQTIAHGEPWLNQQWLNELLVYCPGLWVIVHPRAAGLSLFAFSLLVAILALAWLRRGPDSPPVLRLRWAVPATLALFALWANLHGGFVAGLLLIAVVAFGLALEWRLGLVGAVGSRRVGLLALTGVLAAWLWSRTREARSLTPALVVIAFLVLALVSLRNIVFVGPVLALAVASLAPDRRLRIPLPLIGLAVAASAGVAATWAIAVGPARNEPLFRARLIEYALRHPPPRGHIAAYAGIGSYMLWRAPRAPVELDGWLEHFTPAELRGTYAVLDGRVANPIPEVRRLRIGAAIVDRHRAIRALRAHGFEVELSTPAGAYLVRRPDS